MPKYVILLNWTEQGVKNVKETVNRYQAAERLAEGKGVKFDSVFWTTGPYDLVAVADAPDGETATAFSLQLAAGGNLRTITMRAFNEDEMTGIIAKMD